MSSESVFPHRLKAWAMEQTPIRVTFKRRRSPNDPLEFSFALRGRVERFARDMVTIGPKTPSDDSLAVINLRGATSWKDVPRFKGSGVQAKLPSGAEVSFVKLPGRLTGRLKKPKPFQHPPQHKNKRR
jgi:hypothetical protein